MDNLHTLLDSSSLTAYVYSNRLVYIIEFPLVQDPFTLYHIFSTPIQHPNSSLHTTILPEHIYLATDPSGQYYISTSTLDNCKTFTTRRNICKNLMIYDATVRPICEIQVLFGKTTNIPEICTTTTFPALIQTFQPLNFNRWLYILNEETSCVLQCHNDITNYKLQGSGIVTLPQGCKLHTGYSTLSAYQSSEKNTSFPIIIPDIRTDDCFRLTKAAEAPHLLPITMNETPLDSLQQIKTHLDMYSNEINKFRANLKSQTFIEKHNSKLVWIYFLVGFSMFIYLLRGLCKRMPSRIFERRRPSGNDNERSCIQIFNNCFDNSRRQGNTQMAIPMRMSNNPTNISCISEDEDDESSNPSTSQRSGANTQSLF